MLDILDMQILNLGPVKYRLVFYFVRTPGENGEDQQLELAQLVMLERQCLLFEHLAAQPAKNQGEFFKIRVRGQPPALLRMFGVEAGLHQLQFNHPRRCGVNPEPRIHLRRQF